MSAFRVIAEKVHAGERLGEADALVLLRHPDLSAVGQLADRVRRRRHPEGVVTYIVDRNINYTNVCVTLCKFCAFYRRPGDPEGYAHPLEVIYEKIRETKQLGGVQILPRAAITRTSASSATRRCSAGSRSTRRSTSTG